MANIKVRVWEDRIGNILGKPVREDLQKKLAKHMEEMTGYADSRFFFQEGTEAEEFKQNCSHQQRWDLSNGSDIFISVDPWIMAHWYGYDAYTLFE